MIETKTDPNGCVACNTDGRCIGYHSCPHCQTTTVYCDGCGEEISDGYECNGEQLCRECAEVLFDDILSEEGLPDETPIDVKAELCGADWTVF